MSEASRQVRVNLKLGRARADGRRYFFSRRRGRLYSMSTFVCRRYSRSHCPLVYPEVLTRFAYVFLSPVCAKTGVYSTLPLLVGKKDQGSSTCSKSSRLNIRFFYFGVKFSRIFFPVEFSDKLWSERFILLVLSFFFFILFLLLFYWLDRRVRKWKWPKSKNNFHSRKLFSGRETLREMHFERIIIFESLFEK